MGLLCCGIFFACAFGLTFRSRINGLGFVLAVGYMYGFIRANLTDTFGHFMFDAAACGFYAALVAGAWPKGRETEAQANLRIWTCVLCGWVVAMFLIPMQAFLIQVVGLRGNCFLLPFIVIGSRLNRDEIYRFAFWIAALNFVAFGFAAGEFLLGVPTFFPENDVTRIIYESRDVIGYFRIPATFANAHSYGGMMVLTVPWLMGAWMQKRSTFFGQMFLAGALGVAMIGVFLSATRTSFLELLVVVVVATFSGRMKGVFWVLWIVLLCGIAYIVSGEQRLQRFTTITDPEMVLTRLQGSVNMDFVQLLQNYPLGNGLGAGGTSIPYFLQYLLKDPVVLENEYSRILLEQGIPGLLLWFAFIAWFAWRRPAEMNDPWLFSRFTIWGISVYAFAIAVTGIGMLTAIPASMLFLIGLGFAATPPPTTTLKRPQPSLPKKQLMTMSAATNG